MNLNQSILEVGHHEGAEAKVADGMDADDDDDVNDEVRRQRREFKLIKMTFLTDDYRSISNQVNLFVVVDEAPALF